MRTVAERRRVNAPCLRRNEQREYRDKGKRWERFSTASTTNWRTGSTHSPCSSWRPRRTRREGRPIVLPKVRLLPRAGIAGSCLPRLHGSGVETVAHLRDNGRIVAHVLRLFGQAQYRAATRTGRGTYYRARGVGNGSASPREPRCACRDSGASVAGFVLLGFSVPLMEHTAERDILDKWARHTGERRTCRVPLAE
jgi:hypothetical protein